MDLLEVTKRIRSGDLNSWSTFLPLFQEIGRRTVRRLGLSAVDTDEILQDVLVALYRGRLNDFRGDHVGQLVNFLKRIIYRRALDWIEKERPRSGNPDTDRSNGSDSAQPASNPLTRLGDEECEELLEREVGKLSRADRELYLMKFQGLKEREIAEQTRRPKGTVAVQISRLLARLRERLKAHGCLD